MLIIMLVLGLLLVLLLLLLASFCGDAVVTAGCYAGNNADAAGTDPAGNNYADWITASGATLLAGNYAGMIDLLILTFQLQFHSY